MSEDSPLKASGSHMIFGLRSPHGPGMVVVNTQGVGGSRGFGSDRCRGNAHNWGTTGGAGGCVDGCSGWFNSSLFTPANGLQPCALGPGGPSPHQKEKAGTAARFGSTGGSSGFDSRVLVTGGRLIKGH